MSDHDEPMNPPTPPAKHNYGKEPEHIEDAARKESVQRYKDIGSSHRETGDQSTAAAEESFVIIHSEGEQQKTPPQTSNEKSFPHQVRGQQGVSEQRPRETPSPDQRVPTPLTVQESVSLQSVVHQPASHQSASHHSAPHQPAHHRSDPLQPAPQYTHQQDQAQAQAQLGQITISEREYIEHLQYNERRLQEQLHSQTSQLRQTEQQNTLLNTLLAETEQQLAEVRQDLGASRAFVGTEDSGDAQALIKALKDINEGVDDMAFQFSQSLPEGVLLSSEAAEAFCTSLPGGKHIFTLAEGALRRKASVQDFLERALTFWFHSFTLRHYVFKPFVPGMWYEQSDHVKRLNAHVCRNEPQERSARWRAITYAHAFPQRDDKRLIEKAVNELVSNLIANVPLLFPQSSTGFEVAGIAEQARQVMTDAIDWQDKAKSSYLSFDFEPYLIYGGEEFDPSTMEPSEPLDGDPVRSQKHIVLAGSGFGLKAWKSVVRERKKVERQMKVSFRAPVVCQNWLWSAEMAVEPNSDPTALGNRETG